MFPMFSQLKCFLSFNMLIIWILYNRLNMCFLCQHFDFLSTKLCIVGILFLRKYLLKMPIRSSLMFLLISHYSCFTWILYFSGGNSLINPIFSYFIHLFRVLYKFVRLDNYLVMFHPWLRPVLLAITFQFLLLKILTINNLNRDKLV